MVGSGISLARSSAFRSLTRSRQSKSLYWMQRGMYTITSRWPSRARIECLRVGVSASVERNE